MAGCHLPAREIKVVAYDDNGKPAAEETIRTAGKPYALKLTPYTGPESTCDDSRVTFYGCSQTRSGDEKAVLKADGEDLCYVNVSVVDRDGNPVPCDSRTVNVKVEGAGTFRAIANGDPTCLEMFHIPSMHLFSGQLTAIVQSGSNPGNITVKVSAKGLRPASVVLESR